MSGGTFPLVCMIKDLQPENLSFLMLDRGDCETINCLKAH